MKKIIASLLLLTLFISVLSVGTLAVNKSDLLAEAAKSPVYKYVKVAVENAARNVKITDEQAEQILPIIQRGVAIVGSDEGSTVIKNDGSRLYTQEQFDGIMQCVKEICAILGYTYTFEPVANATHIGDIIFKVYDENGALVFEYDGDIVSDTAVEEAPANVAYLAAGCALLVFGLAAAVVVRKRYSAAA